MLQNIRDRATGPLAWLIVGIICIPFAFFGIEAFRSDGGAGPVAKVAGDEISDAQLNQRYQQRYQQLQQMLGESFRADMINPDQLRQSVLDGMIQEAATAAYLEEKGYRVPNEKVLGFVRGQQAFQDNGNFSQALYRDTLARQGLNPVQYEDNVRAFLAAQQLRQAVSNTVVVTEAELKQAWAQEKQTRRFAWREYDAAKLEATIKVADDEIAALFEERKDKLMAPERLKLDYVELSLNELKEQLEVDDSALQALYEEMKESRFQSSEERMARHILVRSSEDDAKEKIEAAAARIAAGEDFATVAGEVSQDPGSKNKGGDLGWVSRGMMVKPFEDSLFALADGAVSEPVESQFGWHIIKLEELRPARLRGFDEEEVQAELADIYRDQQAREKYDAAAEQLEQLSFENPGSLQPVADALGMEIKTTAWLTRDGGAGIGSSDDVLAAGFSDLVLKNEENSLPIAIGRRQVVVRLNSHEASRPQTLEEVRGDLIRELLAKAVREKLSEMAEADKAELDAGKSLEELAENEFARNQPAVSVQRDASAPNRVLVGKAFQMPAPKDAGVSVEVSGLAGGRNLAVIVLSEVADGDWTEAKDEDKAALRQRLIASRSNFEYAALEAALREQVEVKIYERNNL